jgi:hypothetical protein
MIIHIGALLALAVIVTIIAVKNNDRLNRITVTVLVILLAVRELGIAVYAHVVLEQAAGAGEALEAFKQGALDAMDSYTFISFHLVLAYVFIAAVCFKGCRSSPGKPPEPGGAGR